MNLPEKWKNFQPNTRALIVVLPLGAIGAVLSCWWNLSIGEKDFASGVANLNWFLRIFLGMFGAAATVFVVARTDTAKLIHCGIIAALAGMAGPYLVIKALSTVASVNPNLVQIGSAISIVDSATTKLNNTIQTPTAGTNPQKIVDAFDQTAQATTSYLAALKNAPANEKQRALADTKVQLQETLKVLGTAAAIVPKQSVPLIKKLATEARNAGAPEVAQEAQKILDTNSTVRIAAETAENIGKVYFITPAELTDDMLSGLQERIRARFRLADIQPSVHPTRQMAPGLEVVYYRDLPSDKQIANDLGKVVTDYLQGNGVLTGNVRIGKNSGDQTAAPFQFDIHIGPDIAANIPGISSAIATPSPSPKRRSR
jgi:hypothetical protein